jgi:hypothetical protein
MSRLPTVGSDNNDWGNVLNDFLSVSLDTDGTIKSTAVSTKANITDLNPKAISYIVAVLFSNPQGFVMPETTINTATVFTVDSTGAISGTGGTVTLKADGATTPTFSGFTKINDSDDYLVTLNAYNLVMFYYDGVRYWYTIKTVSA